MFIFRNRKTTAVTPYVLYGDNTSISGSSYLTSDSQISDKKKYTIMLYACGTNLETGSNEATHDIVNAFMSKYDLDNMNVLLCTGGTSIWSNEYMSDEGDDGCRNDHERLNIYELRPDEVTPEQREKSTSEMNKIYDGDMTYANEVINGSTLKLLGSFDSVDIGKPETLSGFYNLCAKYYPADNYGTILWNHGGGVNDEVCTGDSEAGIINSTGITAPELEAALASSDIYKTDNKKLAFVGYDACLMGGTELAYNIAPYSDYMIASAEITAGGWNYNDIFTYIGEKADSSALTGNSIDNDDISKKLVKIYYDGHHSYSGNTLTSTVASYDLSKIDDAAKAINQVSQAIIDLYNSGDEKLKQQCYLALSLSQYMSYTYGISGGAPGSYVDQSDYFDKLGKCFSRIGEMYQDSKSQTDLICSYIDDVRSQHFITSSCMTYDGKNMFYRGDGSEGESEGNDSWKLSYDASILAASLYAPSDYRFDFRSSNYETKVRNIYVSMSILDKYAQLIGLEYSDEVYKAECDRIGRLGSSIDYDDVIEKGEYDTYGKLSFATNDDKLRLVMSIGVKGSYDESAYNNNSDYSVPINDYCGLASNASMLVTRKWTDPDDAGKSADIVYAIEPLNLNEASIVKNDSSYQIKYDISRGIKKMSMKVLGHKQGDADSYYCDYGMWSEIESFRNGIMNDAMGFADSQKKTSGYAWMAV